MSIQTADVLDAAPDLIVRDGWRQGPRAEGEDGLCAGEAIAVADKAINGGHGSTARMMAARDALAAVIGTDAVTEWNDTPGRRVSEVLDAFTAAANRERGTG
jgi:hypothetical protein